jgi:hypothetical protein
MEPFEKDELSEGELDRLLVVQERVITKYILKKEKPASGFDIDGLKPVAELRPRIIRSADAKN